MRKSGLKQLLSAVADVMTDKKVISQKSACACDLAVLSSQGEAERRYYPWGKEFSSAVKLIFNNN